jgi:hypothetical protein
MTQDKAKNGLSIILAALTIVLLISSVTIIPALDAFAVGEDTKDTKDTKDKKDKKDKKCKSDVYPYKHIKHCKKD